MDHITAFRRILGAEVRRQEQEHATDRPAVLMADRVQKIAPYVTDAFLRMGLENQEALGPTLFVTPRAAGGQARDAVARIDPDGRFACAVTCAGDLARLEATFGSEERTALVAVTDTHYTRLIDAVSRSGGGFAFHRAVFDHAASLDIPGCKPPGVTGAVWIVASNDYGYIGRGQRGYLGRLLADRSLLDAKLYCTETAVTDDLFKKHEYMFGAGGGPRVHFRTALWMPQVNGGGIVAPFFHTLRDIFLEFLSGEDARIVAVLPYTQHTSKEWNSTLLEVCTDLGGYERLGGSSAASAKALSRFGAGSRRILLVEGGPRKEYGVEIPCATHVVMLDPHFRNPSHWVAMTRAWDRRRALFVQFLVPAIHLPCH
jgi:hypothetical protein